MGSSSFSVVIATYNRPESLMKLVMQIISCSPFPEEIIVVDSSDRENESIKICDRVVYVRSSHKNQPYQRYVGYLVCRSEILIYLDDDLEILDYNVFDVMLNRFQLKGVKGVSVGIEYHNSINEIMSSNVNNNSSLFRVVNFLSGVPQPKAGKISLTGVVGPRLRDEGSVEYFNGPVMGFYKIDLTNIFNPVLFGLFERKLGMGEDKVISMGIGLSSKLWFIPHIYFLHPPIGSTYFQDTRSFQCKVIYSRLYLSLCYGRIKEYKKCLVYLQYYYYAFFRLTFACLRFLSKPSSHSFNIIRGILQGIWLTIRLPFDPQEIAPGIDWQQDAKNDFNRVR
ncbi:MAG: glycosyltransferase [Bacteroidetes bacterium CHB5]|nr:glycosyltransferase [Bacteroidetes bacterium CHB5]